MSDIAKFNRRLLIIVGIYLLFLTVFVGTAHCQTEAGNVVKIFDGDTVQFRTKAGKYYRVRLQGIDAPERRQTHGIECTKQLSGFVLKKTVWLEIYGDDSYKRKLGRLSTVDLPDINKTMIEIGCAWEYSAPLSVKSAYQNTEQAARAAQAGLWQDDTPTEPWQFRASGYNDNP